MGVEEYKPVIFMIGLQFLYAGTSLFTKAALLEEMSSTVFVVYRQCIGFLLVAPLAYFSSREGSNGGSLNWKSFWLIFLLSFLSVTANQNANYMGLSLVSSSVASAMYNLAPGITFFLAYTLGLERVEVGRWGSIAKIVGTVVCVSGAAAMALLKGPKLLNMERNCDPTILLQGGNDKAWLIGCLFTLASTCFWSLALIVQVPTNKMYPDPIALTAWMCLMSTFQCGIVALCLEPNMNAWRLTSPLQIFVCFYAGGMSAVGVLGQTWCIARRGPLFSATFQPLCTAIVTLLGCIFLHEELYVGSLIGGAAVISGLYIVLWGKAKDYSDVNETTHVIVSNNCKINDLEDPLLKKEIQNTQSLI